MKCCSFTYHLVNKTAIGGQCKKTSKERIRKKKGSDKSFITLQIESDHLMPTKNLEYLNYFKTTAIFYGDTVDTIKTSLDFL